MNKKLVGVIAGGAITVATVAGVVGANELTQEIKLLNNSITQIQQENTNKDEEINQLKEELKSKDLDIEFLKEEQKIMFNELEKLKKNYKTMNTKTKVVFDKTNLKSKSGVDAVTLNKVLKGTGLSGLGDAYVQAEKTYGVNAIFLTALTAQESGWGNSNRARTQNNLSGYAVYSDSSAGRTFSTKSSSIMATAKLLANDYLSTNGKHYRGGDIYEVNSVYCPNDGFAWANKITSIANDLVQEINSL